MSNPEQTLQEVEGMTPVKKTIEKVEAEENQGKSVKNNTANEKKNEFEGQLTQLEAIFTLNKVNKIFSSTN